MKLLFSQKRGEMRKQVLSGKKRFSKQRKDDEQCLMMLDGSAYFALNLSLNIPDKVLSETRVGERGERERGRVG